MKVSAAKTCARTPAAQKRVRNLIHRLRALENQCGKDAWANVVAACREASQTIFNKQRKNKNT